MAGAPTPAGPPGPPDPPDTSLSDAARALAEADAERAAASAVAGSPSGPGGDVVYDLGEVDGFTTAPSDQLVLEALQRIASAQAQLLSAEQQAADATVTASARVNEIEEAHNDVMWAKARSLAAARGKKADEELRRAVAKEKALLQRHGHSSFKAYIAVRTATPTGDVHLQLARREYQAARIAWEQVQADLEAASVPTMIVDYTDDEPRSID